MNQYEINFKQGYDLAAEKAVGIVEKLVKQLEDERKNHMIVEGVNLALRLLKQSFEAD